MALILGSVGLQLASATLLKYASQPAQPELRLVMPVLLAVGVLNFGRLLIWNSIHRRFPVSMAYPLSALFIPAILLVAWLMGERIGTMQVAGGIIVTAGIFVILASERSRAPRFPPED